MITDVSQVLLKISILMSYRLTCFFHHVTCLVILSLANIVRICLYLVIYQVTFEFSAHDLAVYPISMAPIFKPLYLYSFTTLLYWQYKSVQVLFYLGHNDQELWKDSRSPRMDPEDPHC